MKKIYFFVSLLSMFIFFISPISVHAATYIDSRGNDSDNFAFAYDGDLDTYYVIDGTGTGVYLLSDVSDHDIVKLFLSVTNSSGVVMVLDWMNENNSVVSSQSFSVGNLAIEEREFDRPSNATRLRVRLSSQGTSMGTKTNLFLHEITGRKIPKPPSIPLSLSFLSDVEKVHLHWDAVIDDYMEGYRIYKNSEVIGETTLNNFTVDNLVPDVTFGFQVSAYNTYGMESLKTPVLYASALAPIIEPVLKATDIMDKSLKLNWNSSGVTYEIYKNGEFIRKLDTQTYINMTLLEPGIDYDFYIIAIDKYGRRTQSNILTVRTVAGMVSAPSVSVTDRKMNSFSIVWDKVLFAESYDILLDGALVENVTGTSYDFLNLVPDTIYNFTVRAVGQSNSADRTLSVRTLPLPIPKIDNASVSPVPGQPDKKLLNYSASNGVTEVKVFVDGELIGTYPADGTPIELDFSEIERDFADIELMPVDEGGQGYTFQALTKSTGVSEIDSLLANFFSTFLVNKNAFWYLGFAAIPITLALLVFFWLRRKFKKTFGESKQEQKALINQPSGEQQYIRDIKEEKRKFIPWKEMTQEQKNEWRQSKGKPFKKPLTDAEKQNFNAGNGFKVVERNFKRVPVGFMGSGGFQEKPDFTYERKGVLYKKRHVKGKGMVYQPKDFENKVKHVSNQFKAVKSAFTGSNKKQF